MTFLNCSFTSIIIIIKTTSIVIITTFLLCEASPSGWPPRFKGEIGDHFYLRRHLHLECPVFGIPFPRIEWFKDERPINLNHYQLKDNDTRLEAGPVVSMEAGPVVSMEAGPVASFEGRYHCRASNLHGSIRSTNVSVQRTVLKWETPKVHQHQVVLGRAGMMMCGQITSVPPASQEWSVEGPGMERSTLQQDQRRYVDHLGDLHFKEVRREDVGVQFLCRCFNSPLDTIITASYHNILPVDGLNDPSPPSLLSTAQPSSLTHPELITAFLATDVHLSCSFHAVPPPHIFWLRGTSSDLPSDIADYQRLLRNNKTIKHGYLDNYHQGDFNSLFNVTFSDSSMQQCIAVNQEGVSTHHFLLSVQSKPFFSSPANRLEDTMATEGSSATLVCAPSGHPTPSILWLKNGLPISDIPARHHLSADQRSLTISQLSKEGGLGGDSSVVQCMASNIHGSRISSALLRVLCRTQLSSRPVSRMTSHQTTHLAFHCNATSDPSTPPSITWFRHLEHGRKVRLQGSSGQVSVSPDGQTLSIRHSVARLPAVTTLSSSSLPSSSPSSSSPPPPSSFWRQYWGEYSCEATTAHSSDRQSFLILPQTHSLNSASMHQQTWFLGSLLLFLLLLLIIIIIITAYAKFIQCRSAIYLVGEREKEDGRDVEEEVERDAFQHYCRPCHMSRMSLMSGAVSISMGSEYKEDDCAPYDEDGSFIGHYVFQ